MTRDMSGKRNPFYGRHHSEATKALLSIKTQQRVPESFRKSNEHREKISLALKGKRHTPEHIEHNRLAHIGQRHNDEWKKQHSLQLKGRQLSNELKERMRQWLKGYPKSYVPPMTAEHRRKIGEANKRRWQRPGFAEAMLQNLYRSLNKRPNKAECALQSILDDSFPNQWLYVGDGKVIIGGKIPDFININGHKAIIELFGEYWHRDDGSARIDCFYKFGYKTLIVWTSELTSPSSLVKKVRQFIND